MKRTMKDLEKDYQETCYKLGDILWKQEIHLAHSVDLKKTLLELEKEAVEIRKEKPEEEKA